MLVMWSNESLFSLAPLYRVVAFNVGQCGYANFYFNVPALSRHLFFCLERCDSFNCPASSIHFYCRY
ncbi:hypothetical protein RIF29_07339 [Crotalaria pallida]|uniref:Secreted protein n=1 Tax=Crotalaria pallida TaxID=3830 RepID=A0AAN9J5N8_CROPI